MNESVLEPLPPNPVVEDGIRVRYLGIARRRVEGQVTGYVYHTDASRRVIDVHPNDLASLLRARAFIIDE